MHVHVYAMMIRLAASLGDYISNRTPETRGLYIISSPYSQILRMNIARIFTYATCNFLSSFPGSLHGRVNFFLKLI